MTKFVFEYQQIKQDDPEPEYTISGVVTDSTGNVIKDTVVTIKFYKVKDDGTYEPCIDEKSNEEIVIITENGNYDSSEKNYFFEEGDYLLLVTAKDYESQTIKVKLPQESKEALSMQDSGA